MKYFELIDELMQFYAANDFANEAIKAKNEFFDLAGMFDEQSSGFDLKMAQFSDWYIFSRKLTTFGRPPIAHFLEARPTRVAAEHRSRSARAMD